MTRSCVLPQRAVAVATPPGPYRTGPGLAAIGRYAVAAASVVLATAITLTLDHWDVHLFLFSFYAAVVGAACLGIGPGIFAVVLSILAVEFFWTPPRYSFEVVPEELPFLLSFIICAIMSLVWSAQRKRTERALQQARDTLEETVEQRTAELVEANAALKTEIAERQTAEEELRRRETLLAQGQKLSRTASWTLQPASGDMRWSAELFEIFATDPAAAAPSLKLFRDRVHPDDLVRFDAAMALAIETSTNFSCEIRISVDGGAVRHVQTLGEVHADPSSGNEVIGTVIDLTERKRTEQALRDAEADLARTLRLATAAELAASIAHEINQPLAAIVANAGACVRSLARHPPALDNAREAADCIVSDGRRAGDVITRIRALLAKEPPHHAPVDINTIIEDVLDLLRSTLDRQRVTVQTQLAASRSVVMGDPVQLQQVLVNLVTNAAEALSSVTHRPLIVTIGSANELPHTVAVTVTDNGVGLNSEEVDRIFDSFYTTKREGIGVGLSISRSIIEAHGGKMSASPILPHGASFRFELPVAEQPSLGRRTVMDHHRLVPAGSDLR